MLLTLVAWGVCGFGMMAPQQARLASASPAHAPLLLSLNTSMLYFGTALGAAVGGGASHALGFARLPWISAAFALAGLLILLTSPRASGPAPVRMTQV
jgi:DHA1 family inner membrane transport protein